MCGIFGYVGKKHHAANTVLEGLKRLEYRGYDSWGIAVISQEEHDSVIVVKKDIGKIGQATVEGMPDSTFSLGHTRWATHGGVTVANAHPHLDCLEQTAVIHNGIVENHVNLKKDLKKKHAFRSETDTEVVAHLIEEKLEKLPLDKAVLESFRMLDGNNAVIVVHRRERKIVAAKNGSPLILGFSEDGNYLASDPTALLPHTKTVHFLEDYEMAVITDKTIELYNVKTGKRIGLNKQILHWNTQQTTKGAFDFFMEKEMREQPGVVNAIGKQNESETKEIISLLKKYDDVVFLGCGTASYACWAATYIFSEIAKKKVTWGAASECSHVLQFMNRNTLVFALSQSGETMDLITVVKKAKQQGAKLVALVNVRGSTLYRLSDKQILIGAGPEKSVASTKAFTGLIAHLVLLAYSYDGRYKDGQSVLVKASKASQHVLDTESWRRLKNLAKKLIKAEHIFVIGRDISCIAAVEIALKIKEISYIHAEGILGGELKHGPLALIEKGIPCIAVVPEDGSINSTISSATEIKARGGFIVGIATKNNPIFDVFVSIPHIGIATLIPAVVAGQILAYHMTVLKKLDPDKPRNLAKSVTVG